MENGKSQLLFIMIVSLASAAESRSQCKRGWVQFGKNCYNFSSPATTFKDAMIFCNNLGAELLELQRKAEEDWIDLQCRVRGKYGYCFQDTSYTRNSSTKFSGHVHEAILYYDMSQIYLRSYLRLKTVSRNTTNLQYLLKIILTLRHLNDCLIINKLNSKH